MILHQFPDLQWLKQKAEQRFDDKQGWEGRQLKREGWPNVILNVNAQNIYRDNIKGPLSLFMNISGESTVLADKRRVNIKGGYFFITNHDQYYTLEVEKHKAETFNIHFGEHFTENIFLSLTSDYESLLDEGDSSQLKRIEFYNKLHPRTPAVNHILTQIKQADNNALLLEEKLVDLITLLVSDHREVKKAQRNLPSIKRSTKHEVVRRLFFATDYIYSFYHLDLTLDELAKVACLSKFHFLRLFKLLFHKTPHQFINEVRAEKAKELLQGSELEVQAIAKSVGFRDSSSFSRMFYQQVGVYPSQYRH